jgi:hypothetical protein
LASVAHIADYFSAPFREFKTGRDRRIPKSLTPQGLTAMYLFFGKPYAPK